MAAVQKLSLEEVVYIRTRLAEVLSETADAFGDARPLYPERLESAVARQDAGFGPKMKYNSVPEVAATLFFGLAMNHPFENGNKRTALVSLLVFLDRNRRTMRDTTESDLYEFVTQVADHALPMAPWRPRNADNEVQTIAEWIAPRLCPLTFGDRSMKYSQLTHILRMHGCTFDKPDRNKIKIRRAEHCVCIGYPGTDYDVPVQTVKKTRKLLHIDGTHGTDSSSFYKLDDRVDSFVSEHRQLLRRLADT